MLSFTKYPKKHRKSLLLCSWADSLNFSPIRIHGTKSSYPTSRSFVFSHWCFSSSQLQRSYTRKSGHTDDFFLLFSTSWLSGVSFASETAKEGIDNNVKILNCVTSLKAVVGATSQNFDSSPRVAVFWLESETLFCEAKKLFLCKLWKIFSAFDIEQENWEIFLDFIRKNSSLRSEMKSPSRDRLIKLWNFESRSRRRRVIK